MKPAEDVATVPVSDDWTADRRAYAADFGVAESDAAALIARQHALAPALRKVQELAGARLVGVSVAPRPSGLDVKVSVTEGPSIADLEGLLRPFADVTIEYVDAPSKDELLVILKNTSKWMDDHPEIQGTYVDEKELRIEIDIAGAPGTGPQLIAALRKEGLGEAPAYVNEYPSGATLAPGIRGGNVMRGCSVGWSAKGKTTGDKNIIVMAAHCGTNEEYRAFGSTVWKDLIYGGGAVNGETETRYHRAPVDASPSFYADSIATARPVTSLAYVADMTGSACHRGSATGYSCGIVESTSYTPGDGACGGPCDSVWIKVEGASLKCYPGDSGGPTFFGQAAYGIYWGQLSDGTTADDCSYLVYSAIRYVDNYLPVWIQTS